MNDIYELEKIEEDESPAVWPKENPHLGLAALSDAMKTLSVTVDVAIKAIQQLTKVTVEYVYGQYRNRRVVHLALRSKRPRTRKKNRNRIIRDMKKKMKGTLCDGKNIHTCGSC